MGYCDILVSMGSSAQTAAFLAETAAMKEATLVGVPVRSLNCRGAQSAPLAFFRT